MPWIMNGQTVFVPMSQYLLGERNKTGLNSAGGRCWTTQGDENRRHKSPPDKKKKKNQIVALLTHDRNSCICILGLYRLVNSFLRYLKVPCL